MVKTKKSRNKILWQHIAVYPESFIKFRQLRNLVPGRLTDNSFLILLLQTYLLKPYKKEKSKGGVK